MKKLLTALMAVFLAGAIFSSVPGLIWPGPDYPAWATRLSAGVFLANLVLLGVAGFSIWRAKS